MSVSRIAASSNSLVKLGHATFPVLQLGTGTDVVSLASDLFTLGQHLLDLSMPHRQQLLHLLHHLAVATFINNTFALNSTLSVFTEL